MYKATELDVLNYQIIKKPSNSSEFIMKKMEKRGLKLK